MIELKLATEEEHIYAKVIHSLILTSIFFCFGLQMFPQSNV
ncbi:hypothetical protein COO91_08677 [Nostoc flagelliforme CCNUN1]|uniref:Uncharacterized protein n=1 Tax=Nostoc flagelliforme CCNUN1 TaxID=2038116 RepID=A0A2K8T4A7_9NOSO|nr:hypothetical protein COO91_08677 [Nostoc flagelliforme CCNUN1]